MKSAKVIKGSITQADTSAIMGAVKSDIRRAPAGQTRLLLNMETRLIESLRAAALKRGVTMRELVLRGLRCVGVK